MLRAIAVALSITFAVGGLQAQTVSRQPLDHSAYEIWKAIESEALSPDGQFLLYRLTLQDGDAELVVHGLASEAVYAVPRGTGPRFTDDSRFVVFTIAPELTLVRAAKREKTKPEDQPKDSLGILDLTSGLVTRIERAKSFQLPEDGAGWLAYLVEPTRAAPDSSVAPDTTAAGRRPGARRPAGDVLVVRDLTTGAERRFEGVNSYAFSKTGSLMAYVAAGGENDDKGVWLLRPGDEDARLVASGASSYQGLAFDEAATQLAFLAEHDGDDRGQEDAQSDAGDGVSTWILYHWRDGWDSARPVVAAGTPGVPEGWTVSERPNPSFSRDGRRLFFGTAPAPQPEPKDTLLEEEKVTLDVWHWQDPYIQPMQLRRARRERDRSYQAVVHLRDGHVVQLATSDMPDVSVGVHGNADVAVGTSDLPYRQLISWDTPGYEDVYLVDVRTGERRLILEETQASVRLSPDGRYLTWYDYVEQDWFARDVRDGRTVNLTEGIPHPLFDEDFDTPSRPRSYGSAGWTADDRLFLVYDRYDVWATDPTGRSRPRNITEGRGRAEGIRFRAVSLDREADAVDPRAPILLSAFQLRTKDAGFFRDRVEGTAEPERLAFSSHRYSTPRKAEEANVLLFTRSSVAEFPDVWVSDLDFAGARKVSGANPQQADYRWATVELVEWLSADGTPLQGLLYKPDDFDPGRKYPLMVNFYEQDSDNLHVHFPPIPHRSVIKPIFYASRGYVVFIPDIAYRTGYPGESALNAVVPGVLHLIDRGYIDEERIGVQGHSWGGYQIAYLVTRTNLFRAAAAGAIVSNMTSAYGGIRWESGMSRMFQYERDQSRIGASLWEAPIRYLENSPIFWADKIETPLLMMANDNDGAVPWYQGIEMFTALRRLGKPAWMVNYNGEPHWPVTFAEKRDWNIRLQQFFDHFLMDAPAPVWLEHGIPATEKGRTLGLEVRD